MVYFLAVPGHSSQRSSKFHLKKIQSHLKSQFYPEMTLLKPQQNFQSHLKCPVHSHLKYMLWKVIKMTGVKLTVGQPLLIGIYWYQSTNRRFIHSHLLIHSHKGGWPNNSKHIFRVHIKHYWHFQGVTFKNNTTHSSRHQSILTFSESYWLTILQTFSDFISLPKNTDIFRELLANNTKQFSRVYIKQYWHFQRVPFKLNQIKNFFQS